MLHRPRLCLLAVALFLAGTRARADEIGEQVATVARVGPQGSGSAAARAACDALSARGAEMLPRVLAAMETENSVAANWYRSVYEAIVARELTKASPAFPIAELKDFVADSQHSGRVRRLCLTLCDRVEPGYSQRLVPKLLDDPEFRNDAVEAALASGQRAIDDGDSEKARAEFRAAFDHSRDASQAARAAGKLAGFGERVDMVAHLGLVVDWWLLGPFDAPGFSGFAKTFPPEQAVDLKADYSGPDGTSIRWIRHRTSDTLGLVNLVAALAPVKEAVGYAYSRLNLPDDRPAQLRCGADDNCTVWLNGRKVFGREQWLNGTRFDRFVVPVQLRRGTNELLVKVCQGPPNKDPQVSNNWSLQLRFCDSSGRGVPFTSALLMVEESSQ